MRNISFCYVFMDELKSRKDMIKDTLKSENPVEDQESEYIQMYV